MIEIKNKHMVLFPEDRLIGAAGDVNSARRKFVLTRVQDEFDLSDMVAWIKIDPVGSGEDPYEQMLKKEISADKIILTWTLSAANLKKAGELGVQIIFAAKDYFRESDLAGLSDNDLIVPAAIKGVSAPVWQSYPETFVVCESIDDTVAYEEMTKNVLVSAAASAVGSAESAIEAASAAESSAQSAMVSALSASVQAQESKQSVSDAKAILRQIEIVSTKTDESAALAQSYCDSAAEKVKEAEQLRDETQTLCSEAALAEDAIRDMATYITEAKDKAAESAAKAQAAKEYFDNNKIEISTEYPNDAPSDTKVLSEAAVCQRFDELYEQIVEEVPEIALGSGYVEATNNKTQDIQAILNDDEAPEFKKIFYPSVQAVADYVSATNRSKEDKSNKVKTVSDGYPEEFGEEDYLSALATDAYINHKLAHFQDHLEADVIPPMTTKDMVQEINEETIEDGNIYFPSVNAVVGYVDSSALYRKIFEHTILEGEDIISFDIEQDVEGNSFNLSEFVVYFEHQGYHEGTPTTAPYLMVTLKVDGKDYSYNGAAITCLAQKNPQYARVEFFNRGRWIANGVVNTDRVTNLGTKSLTTTGARTNVGASYDGKLATGIRLKQAFGASVPFAVGTKVEIWGR